MQERIDREKREARYWFDSLAELAKYLDGTEPTWRSRDSRTIGPSRAWDLQAGYDEAWKLARFGWIEGAERAGQALKALPPLTPAPVNRVDFYGHLPHVPRFCAGAPDNMIRRAYDPNQGTGAVLTLIVPVNALGSVETQHMANFGLGVAQYVNQMETNGVRVEVIGAICSRVSGWRVAHCWTVKRADQPLDLAVLAFAIGHPAMFRRLGFALREHCAAPADPGYGRPIDVHVNDAINAPTGSIVLNGMRHADSIATTPAKAGEYITKQIDAALDKRDAA